MRAPVQPPSSSNKQQPSLTRAATLFPPPLAHFCPQRWTLPHPPASTSVFHYCWLLRARFINVIEYCDQRFQFLSGFLREYRDDAINALQRTKIDISWTVLGTAPSPSRLDSLFHTHRLTNINETTLLRLPRNLDLYTRPHHHLLQQPFSTSTANRIANIATMAALPEAAGMAALNHQSAKRAIDESKSHTATPRSSTPPRSDRSRLEPRHSHDNAQNRALRSNARKSEGARASPFDIDAVDSALLREFQRPQRESTPGASPHRKRQRINGDRFIPTRSGQDLQASFSLLHEDGSPATPSKQKKRTPHGELHFQKTEEANRTFSHLLRAELFESSVPQAATPTLTPTQTLPTSSHIPTNDGTRAHTPPTNATAPSLPSSLTPSTPHKNLFSYMSPRHHNQVAGHPTPSKTPQSRHGPNLDTRSEIYSLSPVRFGSQQMLLSPRRQPRAVSKVPYKVLDAPELADDFYLNLVDWGSANILGVGLGSSVYMWNAQTSKVNKLCTLDDDTVTSVSWIQKGTHLAIGTGKGLVQIWDAEKARRLRTMTGHTARVGSLAWNTHILTSGSRDRLIYHRDVRAPDQWLRKLVGHKQEVCGLKWNCEDGQLASGGNDNKLMVWDKLSETPLWKFSDHTAAVKAISWSPHQRGLLASGGGTADRRIIFHDTVKGSVINEIDTGSQVCNIAWSKNSNEIVSTHGYSQNQIVVWKYPSMTQVASLTGHTYRVLYLAMSPDGRTIVTGAGDETLRFWSTFGRRPGTREDGDNGGRLADLAVIR
ncbi:cell division cycle 20 1 cofactor-APC complex [Fusarium acutatum]|uniref:Cell division cycle 20 1 cofactor-APC complex n=1 Tax=Fusarium acutatum TaxID=78861 RepID=A0A8H4NH00_9HYPO|nr:cell division cycle 20 1 cofactor-APC complex [Fusarium acutatum]